MASSSFSRRYNELNLEEKVKLIKDYKASRESYATLAQKYKIGKSSVGRIIRNAEKHFEDFEGQNLSAKRHRKLRKTKNSDLNILMKQWFDEARTRNVPISGPLIQERALKYAEQLGLDSFKASHGWLQKWCAANNISSRTISGESASADTEAAKSFKEKIPEICRNYEPKDIYNADETAMFWKGFPNKTLAVRGDACKGGKHAKDRLSVLLIRDYPQITWLTFSELQYCEALGLKSKSSSRPVICPEASHPLHKTDMNIVCQKTAQHSTHTLNARRHLILDRP